MGSGEEARLVIRLRSVVVAIVSHEYRDAASTTRKSLRALSEMLLTFSNESYSFVSSSGRVAPVKSAPASCSVCNPLCTTLRSTPWRLVSRRLAPNSLTFLKPAPRKSALLKLKPDRSLACRAAPLRSGTKAWLALHRFQPSTPPFNFARCSEFAMTVSAKSTRKPGLRQ